MSPQPRTRPNGLLLILALVALPTCDRKESPESDASGRTSTKRKKRSTKPSATAVTATPSAPAAVCVAQGGTVVEQPCFCSGARDFYQECNEDGELLVGTCSCPPVDESTVNTCDCGKGKCWTGTRCLTRP